MAFEINVDTSEPRKLTQSVLQVTALLDMYQAELARVLCLKCGDIGELSSARCSLKPGTVAWGQAIHFIRFYQLLFDRMKGDGMAMRHWLRVENSVLDGVPHLMIVDNGRLEEVIHYLESASALSGRHKNA